MSQVATVETWQAHYATPDGCRLWPSEALVRFINGRQFANAIEAGCGNGANLWLLAEHAEMVVGVDGCQDAVDLAREYMSYRGKTVAVFRGDVFELPVHDMSQDLVVDSMVGQHVAWDDQPRLFAEYRRVLRPGGTLFRYNLAPGTTTEGAKPIARYTFADLPKLFPNVGPVCIPSDEALAGLLTVAGFVARPTIYQSREYRDGLAVARYGALEAVRT